MLFDNLNYLLNLISLKTTFSTNFDCVRKVILIKSHLLIRSIRVRKNITEWFHFKDDEKSRGEFNQPSIHELQKSLIAGTSIEEEDEEPLAPLKTPKEEISKYFSILTLDGATYLF